MTKRGFAEVSGHHLEQQKLKKKVEDHSICDAERLESNEASVRKDGSTISVNAVLSSTTNSLSSDCLPVEDALSEKKYSVYEESSSEVFESQNDLKGTILKQQSTSMRRRKDILSDFSVCCSEETVGGEPSSAGCYPDNNENSALSKITGDALTVENSINGEKSLHSYLTDGLLIQANAEDVAGMAINYTSYSAEVVKQHMIDSMPILNECDNDNNSEIKSQKMIQATATEKVNSAIHNENISACTISPAISIEITQKVVSGNFKGELSLPPSPITGVVDSFVDKPNSNNNYLNSLNVEETAFSFQLPNKILCKEIPNIETAFEMQGRLGKVAESHDCFQNLTEQNVVSIGIHGDRITQEKEGITSFSSSSISEDDSILKLREKEVQGAFPVLSERSITSCNRKKLLVLDLNGLLCDIVNDYTSYRGEKRIGGKPIFKRPFCDDFLKFCFDKFDIGIWSSRRKYNVDSALDYLMGEFKHKLLFCWDQSKCTYTGLKTLENHYKPLVLKELKKLWDKEESDLPWEKGEFSPSNTLLLDDSPYKALLNPPHTAIFPNPYQYNDEEDRSLGPGGDVRVYLENLLMADNVQHYVEEHPFGQPPITTSDQHWNFYCDIIKRHATPSS